MFAQVQLASWAHRSTHDNQRHSRIAGSQILAPHTQFCVIVTRVVAKPRAAIMMTMSGRPNALTCLASVCNQTGTSCTLLKLLGQKKNKRGDPAARRT